MTTTTEQGLKAKDTKHTLIDLLAKNSTALKSLVPEHLTPERLMRVAVNCVSKTPALQKCTPESLLKATMFAAEIGLEPGGALGHLYLVPFGTEVTPIIGYRGFLELARRTGQLRGVDAVVVRRGDKFKVTRGLSPNIEHEPDLEGGGEMTHVYAVARLADGSVQFEVMTRAQVDAIRARSRSGQSGPWVSDYEEMAKKTVFRRLAKWLPVSSERLQAALEADNQDFIEGEAEVLDSVLSVKEKVRGAVEKVRRMPIVDMPAEGEVVSGNA